MFLLPFQADPYLRSPEPPLHVGLDLDKSLDLKRGEEPPATGGPGRFEQADLLIVPDLAVG
jgi:hypothetical protein